MKKIILCITVFSLFLLTACTGMGTTHTSDPNEYGTFKKGVTVPDYMPESLDGYTINEYSYTQYSYMDTCYEVFLDITVTKEQFDTLISGVRSQDVMYYEQEARYADGYTEIVFCDSYKTYKSTDPSDAKVGWADIDKVIYNEETGNIIFELFHANDTGVYELEKVAYFNKFGITQEEYLSFSGSSSS